MTVEQLRRSVPGGIGAYARGLLSGLAAVADDRAGDRVAGDGVAGDQAAGDQAACDHTDIEVTLFASRAPGQRPWRRGGVVDPVSGFGRPVRLSHLPGPIMTRAWDHGHAGIPGGFDIVHSVSLASPPQPLRGGARSVITVHDMAWRKYPEATTRRGRRWHEAALGRAIDSTARLVVTSGFVAADLTRAGVEEGRITIVHGGSDHLVAPDPQRTDDLLRRLGVAGEFVLTVGTVEPRKNLQRLVEAYALARPSLPEPWPLVVVGPKGWGPALSRTVRQEGVHFAGAVADGVLSGLYQRARAFAYVPLTEGYGLPPLEAMRHGTPSLVAWEVPSVHDLGQAGPPPALMVNPLEVGDIAKGLTTILTDEAVRADLGGRGRTYARARHLEGRRPLARRAVAVAGVTGAGLHLSLDVSAVPARPGGVGYYTLELAGALCRRDDVALTLVSRRNDATRWRGALGRPGRGAAGGAGLAPGPPGLRTGRLPPPCSGRWASTCTTHRTTPCPSGHPCRAWSRFTTAHSSTTPNGTSEIEEGGVLPPKPSGGPAWERARSSASARSRPSACTRRARCGRPSWWPPTG